MAQIKSNNKMRELERIDQWAGFRTTLKSLKDFKSFHSKIDKQIDEILSTHGFKYFLEEVLKADDYNRGDDYRMGDLDKFKADFDYPLQYIVDNPVHNCLRDWDSLEHDWNPGYFESIFGEVMEESQNELLAANPKNLEKILDIVVQDIGDSVKNEEDGYDTGRMWKAIKKSGIDYSAVQFDSMALLNLGYERYHGN